MYKLLIMCLEFFKAGLFAVGGGLATLPFINQMGKTYGWFTTKELADMLAVAESAPGAIGVNLATYTGFKIYGVCGSILATLSMVLPSFIIIFIIATFLEKFSNNKYIKSIFAVLEPATAGLIGAAGYFVLKTALMNNPDAFSFSNILSNFNITAVIMFLVLLVLTQFKKIQNLHPVVFIISAAVVGIIFKI